MPHLDASDVSVVQGKKNTKATITLTLSQPLTKAITVEYKAVNDTARSPQDYLPAKGTVTIKKGATTAAFTITIVGDEQREATERLR